MHINPDASKRRLIPPEVLIRVYEEKERRITECRHSADRMALLLGLPIEAVCDAARAIGVQILDEKPTFPTTTATAVVRKLFNLESTQEQ